MRGEYNTRQKRELIGFLKEHEKDNFSVDEVVFRLQNTGTQIGRSTVYRYLEAMAETGEVRKYQNAQGVTQYQHVENTCECAHHFHMMCKKCGCLQHVDCELMEALTEHIRTGHGFWLDPKETVLVGLCAACAKEELQNGTH